MAALRRDANAARKVERCAFENELGVWMVHLVNEHLDVCFFLFRFVQLLGVFGVDVLYVGNASFGNEDG